MVVMLMVLPAGGQPQLHPRHRIAGFSPSSAQRAPNVIQATVALRQDCLAGSLGGDRPDQ
jgi:hypothetical protein